MRVHARVCVCVCMRVPCMPSHSDRSRLIVFISAAPPRRDRPTPEFRSVPPHRTRSLNGNPKDASRSSAESSLHRCELSLPRDWRFASRCTPSGCDGRCFPDPRPIAFRSPGRGGSWGSRERGALARSRGASHVITPPPLVIDALASDERATRDDPPRGRFRADDASRQTRDRVAFDIGWSRLLAFKRSPITAILSRALAALAG